MVTRLCSPADEDDEFAHWLDADFSSCNYSSTAFMLCESTQVYLRIEMHSISVRN